MNLQNSSLTLYSPNLKNILIMHSSHGPQWFLRLLWGPGCYYSGKRVSTITSILMGSGRLFFPTVNNQLTTSGHWRSTSPFCGALQMILPKNHGTGVDGCLDKGQGEWVLPQKSNKRCSCCCLSH